MYLSAGSCTLDDMTTWRLGRRPALDGLRGVAVLLVIAAHFGIRNVNSTSAGTTGVTVFFTLSGFLITALLLAENDHGGIRRGAFYMRRARRLVPGLLVCVALAVTLELAITGRIADGDMIGGSLTYTANFVMADGSWGDPTLLGHMWSLAIEEQFYLVWPLALLLPVRLPRRWAIVTLGYLALASVLLRHLMWNDGAGKTRIWMGTDTRADAILIGCALAFALHGRTIRPASTWWAIGGGAALAMLLPWRLTADAETVAVTVPLVAALAAATLIYFGVTSERHTILESRALRYVGSRSYGLYLYHVPIVTALRFAGPDSMTAAWLIALPLTVATAELSWRYVEQPFMRRGSAQLGDRHGAVGRVHRAHVAADL